MNTNQAIKTLLKIAQNQQKMIERLAQLSNQPLPPQHLEPVKPELHPEDVVLENLSPNVRAALRSTMPIVARGNELRVYFNPGHATQANLNYITKVVQHLVNANKLPFAYTVSVG